MDSLRSRSEKLARFEENVRGQEFDFLRKQSSTNMREIDLIQNAPSVLGRVYSEDVEENLFYDVQLNQ